MTTSPGVTSAPAAPPLFADRFHAGVRLTALGLWLGVVALIYWIILQLALLVTDVEGVGYGIIVIVAVVVSQPLALVIERALVRFWPSGRAAELAPGQLLWRDREQMVRFDFGKKLNFWRWRFEITQARRGRVPKGHHCFAVRLVQDDAVAIFYAFASPKQADALQAQFPFYELRREKETGKLPFGGRDPVYLAAENARWDAGAELDLADLEALLKHLSQATLEFSHVPSS
jgi:hypothetical protein